MENNKIDAWAATGTRNEKGGVAATGRPPWVFMNSWPSSWIGSAETRFSVVPL